MFAAFFSSIGHYVFFSQLDSSRASGDQARISQSYTTAISLLLVTTFKSSLLGSVGICSVQYLWFVLRCRPMALRKVESLFQLRHNPLELANPRVILSVSFVIAAYTWIVPFAAIYPPSALTIASRPFPRILDLPLSVPAVSFDADFNPLESNNVSRLATIEVGHSCRNCKLNQVPPDIMSIVTRIRFWTLLSFLRQFSKSVIATGDVVQLPMPLGENSSYTLEFLGPQLSCRRVQQYNHSMNSSTFWFDNIFEDLVLGNYNRSKSTGVFFMTEDVWPITQHKILATTACVDSKGEGPSRDANLRPTERSPFVEYLVETTRTNCTERYVSFRANIAYSKGVRSIAYTTNDPKQLYKQKSLADMYDLFWETSSKGAKIESGGQWKGNGVDTAFRASPEYASFQEQIKERLRYWNAYSIYGAVVETLTSATHRRCTETLLNEGYENEDEGPKQCNAEWMRPNGTLVPMGPVRCTQPDRGILEFPLMTLR